MCETKDPSLDALERHASTLDPVDDFVIPFNTLEPLGGTLRRCVEPVELLDAGLYYEELAAIADVIARQLAFLDWTVEAIMGEEPKKDRLKLLPGADFRGIGPIPEDLQGVLF